MSLTVKHLNDDASFLLSLASLEPAASSPPFRILLDPWITGPSIIGHRAVSYSTHNVPPCVDSLRELPPPDLVLLSLEISDHCNEATLRQLVPENRSTSDDRPPLILAAPKAAAVVRSWRCFDDDQVRALTPWSPDAANSDDAIVRIPIPPTAITGGSPGEVTVAYVQQQPDVFGVHVALAITYRPPMMRTSASQPPAALSVVFSPHGIPYANLAPLAGRHLAAERALPLTALLHSVAPVHMLHPALGAVNLGATAGCETAARLAARAWVATHDGDTNLRGLSAWLLRTQTLDRASQVAGIAAYSTSPTSVTEANTNTELVRQAVGKKTTPTELLDLGSGEEIVLAAAGLLASPKRMARV